MKRIIFIILLCITFSANSQIRPQALVSFSTDQYSEPTDRVFNMMTIGAGVTNIKSTFYVLFNQANLTESNNFYTNLNQFEFDFYHNITKTTSCWANYAFSDDKGFPKQRFMFRIWQQLPEKFLISGGFKYYYSNIYTATFGLERYMGNYWLEGKTFIFFKDPKTKYAFQLNSRYFWKDVNYLQLTLMTGAAPDEPWRTGNLKSLSANSIRLSTSTFIDKRRKLQLKAGIGYSREEYDEDIWRNRFVGNIGLIYTIK